MKNKINLLLCILIALLMILSPSAIADKTAPAAGKSETVERLPKVLVFGDSISGGYSRSLAELLDGKAEVVKLGAVATYRIQKEAFWHSSGIAKALDFGSAKACIADFERFEKHLSETKYDVIHFNFGLNDIFRGRNGAWHNPVDQYAKDLQKIVTLLKKNGAKVIWASITPIPDNDKVRPKGDDLVYNAAAEKVMKANGIQINDLYSVITKWDGYGKWKQGGDVHFSGAVYAKLAEQIAKVVTAAIDENPRFKSKGPKLKRVILTFDDSCKSHATVVAPLLKNNGFNATFYITEGFSFNRRKDIYMTWEEIKKLHDQGFEIGNHTKAHHDMRRLKDDVVKTEIEHIDQQCKKYGITKPVTFAYPGYHTSEAVLKVLKEKGYKFARTGGGRASCPDKDDPLLLPDSICPTPKTTFEQLKKAADQADDKHIPIFTFHGVPDAEHGWVSTKPEVFEKFVKYLKDAGFQAIALRDYPTKKSSAESAKSNTPAKKDDKRLSSKKSKKKMFPPNSKFLTIAGHDAYLAMPEGVKPGSRTPWLWYCPSDYNLPGRLEQWMMNKCLANGIAVAGINLKGDFGTPAGRKIQTAFYKELTDNHGLTRKVCMLARSYGGTQMYNWAAEHPESIACLAGIYPVCNLASYPGTKSAAGKYGMKEEDFVKQIRRHNPIDRLAPLAKWDVPIYHNTGDVDTLVPAKDNSFLVEKRYKELGGDITVTIFKGQGHNYWTGFFEDEAMAEFIIKHAKRVAALPRVLFFGDSICGGYSNYLVNLMEGKAEMVKLGAVAGYRIKEQPLWQGRPAGYLNFGNAMMCVSDFDRFKRHLDETKYDVIHFNFGLNDIFRGRNGKWHSSPEEYAEHLTKIIALLKTNGAKIIWANTTSIPDNATHMPVGDDLIYNAAAEKVMKKNNIPINDLHSVVTKWDGYAEWKKGDDVHFNGAVYSMLAKQIAEKITAQLELTKRGQPTLISPNSPQQATVTVDSLAGAKIYDRMIFGGFIEHLGKQIYGGFFEPGSPLADEKGFRLDVIEAIKELKVPVIRWPGGCFVDSYHWQKGVGKVRQPYDDDRWGVLEPNTFGTHEFVELCRRIGAEPYICQNSLASIQEMADWVEYCNAKTGKLAEMRKKNEHSEPFNVKFWSVGNEKGGKDYIDKVRDTAVAMKQVDPSILVTCSGAHGPSAYINPYLFATAGKHLDILSVHEYWIPNYHKHHTPDYLSCMMLSEKPDTHISTVVKSIDKAGMRGKLKIAFDEWNLRSWHHPGFSGHRPRKVDYDDPEVIALIKARDKSLDPSLYTMADALFCASFFNACFRYADDVTMANISCLVNQTGPLYVHPKGIVKRSHYHTMSMYANLLKERVAKADITAGKLTSGNRAVAVVDAVATTDKTGKSWAVSLVNRHPSDPVTCTVKIGDALLDGVYKATILTGESAESYNDIEHPDRVAPKKIKLKFKKGVTDLPPHSLIIVEGEVSVNETVSDLL